MLRLPAETLIAWHVKLVNVGIAWRQVVDAQKQETAAGKRKFAKRSEVRVLAMLTLGYAQTDQYEVARMLRCFSEQPELQHLAEKVKALAIRLDVAAQKREDAAKSEPPFDRADHSALASYGSYTGYELLDRSLKG
jgi:hypothetical protein